MSFIRSIVMVPSPLRAVPCAQSPPRPSPEPFAIRLTIARFALDWGTAFPSEGKNPDIVAHKAPGLALRNRHSSEPFAHSGTSSGVRPRDQRPDPGKKTRCLRGPKEEATVKAVRYYGRRDIRVETVE